MLIAFRISQIRFWLFDEIVEYEHIIVLNELHVYMFRQCSPQTLKDFMRNIGFIVKMKKKNEENLGNIRLVCKTSGHSFFFIVSFGLLVFLFLRRQNNIIPH